MSLSSSTSNAWNSETGAGVVSAQASIIRTSLEATQVLQSDTLTNLYGVTILGGTANYASFDTGGVYTTQNVVSSVDVVRLNQNQFLSWIVNTGGALRSLKVGVSADGTFTAPNLTVVSGASFQTVSVSSLLRTSGQTVLTGVSTTTAQVSSTLAVSGATTLTGTLSPRKTTVAGLPAVSSAPSYVQLVTDATSAGDCVTGGGAILNLCMASGSGVWIDA